jgi:hypothetical protein
MSALLRVLAVVLIPALGWLLGYVLGLLWAGPLGWSHEVSALVPPFITGPLMGVAGIFVGLWVALYDS